MLQINSILAAFLVVYIVHELFVVLLEKINVRHLFKQEGSVPPEVEEFIDSDKYKEIVSYSAEKSRFGVVEQVASALVLLFLILSGFLPWLDEVLPGKGIFHGLLFLLAVMFILYLVEIPFDYYHTFGIEERYGFNKCTLNTWISDQAKGFVISFILLSLLVGVVLFVIEASPELWWFWAFLAVSVIQILLTVLYPVLIAPLFNKFEPLEDEILSKKVNALMGNNGIRVKGIFQMDAGKRSSHTNAYFTGLGKTKRIVLFDTLIDTHPHEEILAVLSHEIGHFKKKHILKQLIFFEITMLAGSYLIYRIIGWDAIYTTFGFSGVKPYVGLLLIGIFVGKLSYFLKPFYMALSRKFEIDADALAIKLMGTGRFLARALKRMAADNLANLTPHPLYVWFNYSHPPIVERIRTLEASNE